MWVPILLAAKVIVDAAQAGNHSKCRKPWRLFAIANRPAEDALPEDDVAWIRTLDPEDGDEALRQAYATVAGGRGGQVALRAAGTPIGPSSTRPASPAVSAWPLEPPAE